MQQQPKPAATGGRRGIALLLFLVIWVGFVAAWVAYDQDPTELWLVNALTIPVTVEVDDEAIELGPESHEAIVTGSGTFAVVVTADGRELERETITIPKARDIAVFNVLGAAWVFGETVWYTQYGAQAGDRDWELYAFDSFHDIERERVQYAFRPTPRSISISSDSNRATVRFVGVGRSWNWRHTLATARAQGLPGAGPLAERLAMAMPDENLGGAPNAAGSPATTGSAGRGTPQSGRSASDPPAAGGKPRQ